MAIQTPIASTTPQILYRWRKEFSAKQGSSFPGNGKVILTETEQELARLKKELRDTQMERDILKSFYSTIACGITNTT